MTIIQTKSENEARKIIMNLETPTDAIIVAGGDGTLSDVLTGLVRKYNSNLNLVKQCPIGILPLGQTNRMAKSLYHEYDNLTDIKQLIEATMVIIDEKFKMMDMVEVEPIEVCLNCIQKIFIFVLLCLNLYIYCPIIEGKLRRASKTNLCYGSN